MCQPVALRPCRVLPALVSAGSPGPAGKEVRPVAVTLLQAPSLLHRVFLVGAHVGRSLSHVGSLPIRVFSFRILRLVGF